MSTPCPTCQAIECVDSADSALYSLDAPIYPWVLNCPPGFSCDGATQFLILCCGQLVTAVFPPNATLQDQNNAIQEALNACAVRQLFCGELPQPPPTPPGTPPITPVIIFRNSPQNCTAICPDGLPFTFSIPAGTFGGLSQAAADQSAKSFACSQAALRMMCISSLPSGCCANSPFSATVVVKGGVGPVSISVSSGALPFGLNLNTANGVISGIPTVVGASTFSITAVEAAGGSTTKNFTINVSNCNLDSHDYFKLDDTDVGSILGITLVPDVSPIPFAPGIINHGHQWDLAHLDQNLVGTSPTFSFITGPSVSFGFWVNITQYGTAPNNFVMELNGGTAGSPVALLWAAITNSPSSSIIVTDGGANTITAVGPGAGSWHYVVGVYDSSSHTMKFYLDNVLIGSKPLVQSSAIRKWILTFLSTYAFFGTAMLVSIDEVEVWINHALTATEISQRWNGGAGARPPGV